MKDQLLKIGVRENGQVAIEVNAANMEKYMLDNRERIAHLLMWLHDKCIEGKAPFDGKTEVE